MAILTAKFAPASEPQVAGFSSPELNYVIDVLSTRWRAAERAGDHVSKAIHLSLRTRLAGAIDYWVQQRAGTQARAHAHGVVCRALADAYANGVPRYC